MDINITTPENKTYTGPMSGYYPATYGFENDINRKIPYGWTNYTYGYPDNFIELRPEYNGHKNVLMGQLNGSGAWNLFHYFNATEGTIEFWICCITGDLDLYFGETGKDPWDLEISFAGGNIRYSVYIGEGYIYQTIGQYNPGEWDHLRIDFRSDSGSSYEGLNQNEFRIYINEVDSGTYAFNHPRVIEYLQFATGTMGTVYLDAFGFSWDPNYIVGDNLNEGLLLSFENSTALDWMSYSLDRQLNKTILGNVSIPFPEDGPHSIQVFGNDSLGDTHQSALRYFTIETKIPEIEIHTPSENQIFGILPPTYNVSIIEANLVSSWYTLDNGVTNISFTNLNGFIDLGAWVSMPNGPITIKFYAKDIIGNVGFDNVTVIKSIKHFLYVEIVDQLFSVKEFNITFYISNATQHPIDFATIQMWWNGVDVSDDVMNLVSGLYFVSLEPITVAPGEDPILLNMTLSADGYEDKYFETYLAVDPDTLEKDGGNGAKETPLIIILIAIISTVSGIAITAIVVVLLRKRK